MAASLDLVVRARGEIIILFQCGVLATATMKCHPTTYLPTSLSFVTNVCRIVVTLTFPVQVRCLIVQPVVTSVRSIPVTSTAQSSKKKTNKKSEKIKILFFLV